MKIFHFLIRSNHTTNTAPDKSSLVLKAAASGAVTANFSPALPRENWWEYFYDEL